MRITQLPAQKSEKGELTIQDLYPELSESELKDAEDNLRAFFAATWRIYKRLKRERPDVFDTPSDRS